MFPPWYKEELMQSIDYRTHEDLEYSSSFLLPDGIFDDDEHEVDIEDTYTLRPEPTRRKRRWMISLSALISTLPLVMRRCRKGFSTPKHAST